MTLDYRNEYHKVKDLEQLYQKKYVEYLQTGSDYAAHGMAAAFIYNLLKERKKGENLLEHPGTT